MSKRIKENKEKKYAGTESDNLILDILIPFSAWMCVQKNSIFNFFFKCIYLIVVFFYPLFALFYILFIVCVNQEYDIYKFYLYYAFFLGFVYIYCYISNFKSKKKLEDYILIWTLYLDEYNKQKLRLKRPQYTYFKEWAIFVFTFCIILFGINKFIIALNLTSNENIILGMMFGSILTCVLFVYGIMDKRREIRKRVVNLFVILVWLLLSVVRIKSFLYEGTKNDTIDMVLLVLSIFYSFLSIYGWTKKMFFSIIVKNNTKAVYVRRKKLLKNAESDKMWVQKNIRNCIQCYKTIYGNMRDAWKQGEKKKVIFSLLYTLLVIFLIICIEIILIKFSGGGTLREMDFLPIYEISCLPNYY